jgi:hypothetical protein
VSGHAKTASGGLSEYLSFKSEEPRPVLPGISRQTRFRAGLRRKFRRVPFPLSCNLRQQQATATTEFHDEPVAPYLYLCDIANDLHRPKHRDLEIDILPVRERNRRKPGIGYRRRHGTTLHNVNEWQLWVGIPDAATKDAVDSQRDEGASKKIIRDWGRGIRDWWSPGCRGFRADGTSNCRSRSAQQAFPRRLGQKRHWLTIHPLTLGTAAEGINSYCSADPSSGTDVGAGAAIRGRPSAPVSAILDGAQKRGPVGRLPATSVIAAAIVSTMAIAPVRAVQASPSAQTASVKAQPPRVSGMDRALYEAAQNGDIAEITTLLNAGANVNAVITGDGSPLLGAGKVDAVRFLLDRGADPNLAVPGDGSALIAASRVDRTHDSPTGEWRSPLSMARRGRQEAMVNYLLSLGAVE